MEELFKLMAPSLPWILVALAGFFRMQARIDVLSEEVKTLREHRHSDNNKLLAYFLEQAKHDEAIKDHERRLSNLEQGQRLR